MIKIKNNVFSLLICHMLLFLLVLLCYLLSWKIVILA